MEPEVKVQRIRSDPGLLRVIPEPSDKNPRISPVEGETNILITSALPYCNNVPHLGNIIGSTLSADVFSRYSRTRNRRTLYICGTDEYGTATETQAIKEGITPRALCDKYHKEHVRTYEWFNIGFDYFGRTSTQAHTDICQSIYTNLGTNEYLEKQDKLQLHCGEEVGVAVEGKACGRFLADRFVEGECPHVDCLYKDARGDQCDSCGRTLDAIELTNPRCVINKSHKVYKKMSTHMYLKLDAIQELEEEEKLSEEKTSEKTSKEKKLALESWIKESREKGNWSPNSVINSKGDIIDARVNAGLKPTPITRDLKWGVPVPGDDDSMKAKVLYVWFDAPIGYPSITANYDPSITDNTPAWENWWLNPENVKLYQFMGKDNVYFHTIYFPAVQIGDKRNWTKLYHLSTTDYLNYEGGKFSKSRNRGIFGNQAAKTGVPSSVWRYYLISTRPETADAMFSWADFVAANNNVLLNNFGNLVNRVLKFVSSQCDGEVPDGGDEPGPLSPNDPADSEFITGVNSLLKEYTEAMNDVKLRRGLQIVALISMRGNHYLQSSGLNKALLDKNPKRCHQVVSRAINLIYVLSVLIYPFMPTTSASILLQLNAPPRTAPDVFAIDILTGHEIGTPKHLFKKIEEGMAKVWRDEFEGTGGQQQQDGAKPTVSKNKVAAAAKKAVAAKPAVDVPKTPEIIALEARIAEQGQVVRNLKGQNPKTPELEAEIKSTVDVLKQLKAEVEVLRLQQQEQA